MFVSNNVILGERRTTVKQFIEVHYYVKAGKRDEFYRALMESGIASASRAEAGNEKYDYFYSPDNENELLLIELWASEEAVRLHGETPHFKALGDLKKVYVADTIISRYEVK